MTPRPSLLGGADRLCCEPNRKRKKFGFVTAPGFAGLVVMCAYLGERGGREVKTDCKQIISVECDKQYNRNMCHMHREGVIYSL